MYYSPPHSRVYLHSFHYLSPVICNRVANFVLKRYAVTATAGGVEQINFLGDVVGTFISLIGLLYSILVGQVFGFLYSQQEVRKNVFYCMCCSVGYVRKFGRCLIARQA